MTMYRTIAAMAVLTVITPGSHHLMAQDDGEQNGAARRRAGTRGAGRRAQSSETQLQARFRSMDTDGDSVITRAEWRGSARAFRQQDKNGDGVLSGSEVRSGTGTPVTAAVSDQIRLDQLNARFSRL